MKKKSILMIAGIVLIIGIVYFEILNPIQFSENDVRLCYAEADYENILSFKEAVKNNSLHDCYTAYGIKQDLPSDNPEDYASISCEVNVNSRTFFRVKGIDMIITDIGKYEDRILLSASAQTAIPNNLDRFGRDSIHCYFYVYTGGMSKQEMIEMVKELKMHIVYELEYFGIREKEFRFTHFEDIEEIKLD